MRGETGTGLQRQLRRRGVGGMEEGREREREIRYGGRRRG